MTETSGLPDPAWWSEYQRREARFSRLVNAGQLDQAWAALRHWSEWCQETEPQMHFLGLSREA